ncbi:lalv9 family protein [Niveomyces insectorum RCEF 264]|uniref:Lalv9 family protein n=1 Tax=Niveomyces insectorum RCEF 264 TaxID=1081102 RepID=A0A162MQD8_9HYPO|nr:lalv9 family protein [Niveomyces insectorum RCEF 264]
MDTTTTTTPASPPVADDVGKHAGDAGDEGGGRDAEQDKDQNGDAVRPSQAANLSIDTAAAAAPSASLLTPPPPPQLPTTLATTTTLGRVAAPPKSPASSAPPFTPLVCVVDFHHARGPEVEMWFGVAPTAADPAVQYDWPLLPFMALSDGAHASTEDFSYFTLLKPADGSGAAASSPSSPSSPSPLSPSSSPTSLFGISCTRQMDAAQLRNRPSDVTRSTVQKAVVVIADSPQFFGMLRERLSVVTKAWFEQREFTDVDILRRFQESLAEEKARGALGGGSGSHTAPGPNSSDDEDRDQYLGMSLRELVHEFRWQTLVLLKCCLLQPKFSLISLIPGLLRNLQDCAGPELDSYARKLTKPTSLRTSDRNSLLTYMGLPLQIFGKGSLFGPYTPLQQLDVLADFGTKSYIVGSTNSLLLQQRDRYSDILINLDDNTVNITSASLRNALQLSVPDRRWIDFITQEVNDTWDESNPGRPKTMGYVGSEEFIRLQFEEYLLSLLSSVKYHNYTTTVNSRTGRTPQPPLAHVEGDPSLDFGADFVEYWSRTGNYQLWQANTDSHIFEFVEPRHPCAGGLSIDDVQRRIAQQVQDLHLDERFAQGREVLGRNIAAGREKASTLFNKLYADMEALRETQRRKAEEARQHLHVSDKASANGSGGAAARTHADSTGTNGGAHTDSHNYGDGSSFHHERTGSTLSNIDLTKAQQTVQSVGVRATAYMSSWAAWAGEKRKTTGWGRFSGAGSIASNTSGGANGNNGATSSGSWSLLGSSSRRGNRNTMSSTTSDASSERGLRMSISSFMTGTSESNEKALPGTPATPFVSTPATMTTTSTRSPGDVVTTPSSLTSTSQQIPSHMVIRNLDDEEFSRQQPPPPPLPSPPLATTASEEPKKVDSGIGNGLPVNLLPGRETPKEEPEKQQTAVPEFAPTLSIGSKVMLLP